MIKVGCFRHLVSKNKAKVLIIDKTEVKESIRMKWVNAVVKVIDDKIRQEKIKEIRKKNVLKKVMQCVSEMSES